MFIFWIVPLGMFVWSIFHPMVAGYAFVVVSALFDAYIFYVDIAARFKPDSLSWSLDEIRIIKMYHLALRYPYGAKLMSIILNGFRWSSFLWVPWLLWNHLWIPAILIGLNFFITSSISVRLDPFFFLSESAKKGNHKLAQDLVVLVEVADKLKIEPHDENGDTT